ncbi:hypothetical protein ACO22_07564 [Paracoccidioides brasiliensis]|uniref:BZIP domain-containing protein n=1 Tax=Paracoccidioides brasiliensis TaxID=121759 RepID=A0A1D2J4Q6_PARBR|nr:hypothetical protein ACO22_07564 [Paracoccidioides brasiliensis]
MSDFGSLYQRSLYLSPDQQDLLLAALSSTRKTIKVPKEASRHNSQSATKMLDSHPDSFSQQVTATTSAQDLFESPTEEPLDSGQLGFDGSPFLDFDFDVDFDSSGVGDLIGDLQGTSPGDDAEPREKRKSIDGNDDEEENGKKRRETDDKTAKKPGRKPLTSEPTTKRKAQNRAAQRAFRERKEKHLKDLENKVDELEKVSQSTNIENKLLRAQVEKLQIELKGYRKRLSWVSSGNGVSPTSGFTMRGAGSKHNSRDNGNNFSFEFPKFSDLPGARSYNSPSQPISNHSKAAKLPPCAGFNYGAPNINHGNSFKGTTAVSQRRQFILGSPSQSSPVLNSMPPNDNQKSNGRNHHRPSIDSFRYYDNLSGRSPIQNPGIPYSGSGSGQNSIYSNYQSQHHYGSSNVSNSASPAASSESQPCHVSSMGTSPEPSLHSPPSGKLSESGLTNTIANELRSARSTGEGEKSFYEKLGWACGCAENPLPASMTDSNPPYNFPDHNKNNSNNNSNGNNSNNYSDTTINASDTLLGFDWLVQQNGGQFDPVLFGDYRDPQDAVLSQDFGTFFNEALPLPDLGSPLLAFSELSNNHANNNHVNNAPPKPDILKQIDSALEADDDEEVVPGEDRSQMLSCTKIWDRLQSMEKFRNGEIDVDSLCSELRTKARCSEGGVVVKQVDVEAIMSRAE